jgi:transcriptional regulator with XRE-family HTH domain
MIEEVGMQVRDVRIALRWSLSDLARNAGLSLDTIRRLERGDSVYDVTLGKVVDAFNGSGRMKQVVGKERVDMEDFEEYERVIHT